MACLGLAFTALAVAARRVAFFPIDVTITRHVQAMDSAWFSALLAPFNALGFAPFVPITYGGIVLTIYASGAKWEAAASAFATLGGAGLNAVVKPLVARPRPPFDLIHVAHHLPGASFPAGHVLYLTAFAGFLCYLVWVRFAPSWPRTALIALILTVIAIMGLARIDAGEHWPSDVLGGYLLGALWMGATVAIYRRRRRTPNLTPASAIPV